MSHPPIRVIRVLTLLRRQLAGWRGKNGQRMSNE